MKLGSYVHIINEPEKRLYFRVREDGYATRDASTEDDVKTVVEWFQNQQYSMVFDVGQMMLVDYFRIMVVRDVIDASQAYVIDNAENKLPISRNGGRLALWQHMPNHMEDILMELLDSGGM